MDSDGRSSPAEEGEESAANIGRKMNGFSSCINMDNWENFQTPKPINGDVSEDNSPVSRYNSMDDSILRDHVEANDDYWSANYKDDKEPDHYDFREGGLHSGHSEHSAGSYHDNFDHDNYEPSSYDHDNFVVENEQLDRLSIDGRLEQSLGHNLITQEIRDNYVDPVGYMSAPEGYKRPTQPARKRKHRGRSRTKTRDLLYYNARSRSVSRTRTAILKGPRRYKSLEHLSYRRRAEQRREAEIPESDEDEEESVGDEEEEEKAKNLKNASFRKKVTLLCLAIADFNSFMCLALMAPFFPQEAEKRNVTSSQVGWIFGVFALVQCVTSPLYGKLLPYLGARFTFLAGNFFTGGCTILFGMVEYFPYNTTMYLAFTFIIRIFLALGCTAVSCSIFALATSTFPDNASFVLGLLESAIGVGLTAGPALGGVLYEALGFKGPFFIVGGFILISTPIFAVVMDVSSTVDDDESLLEVEDGRGLFCRLLSIPTVIVTLISMFVSSVIWIIFDPILEPHLRPYHLSASALGGVFLLMSGTYAILAPFVGKLADSMDNSTPVMVLGHLIGFGSMLILGPSPLIGLGGVSKLWLNLLALAFMGVSVSLSIVPTFDKLLDAADRANIKECFQLHGVIGGLWTSIYAFGEFVGPTLAGWAMTVTTFDWFMTYCAGASLAMAVILIFLWIYEYVIWKKAAAEEAAKKVVPQKETESTPSERTPLLS